MHHRVPHPLRRAALPLAGLLLAVGPLTACHSTDDDNAPTSPPRSTAAPSATPSATSDQQSSPTAAEGTVPDLTGLTVAEARNQLADLDYGMAFTDDSTIGDDSLKVTAQSPAPGTQAKAGTTVTITVPDH
ncbi:PASTA domain-containing protein [Streptomyces sp. NPDC007084]|uniref:PASTA domain-containing protein n=1 Tax=Streptomyces sp. NPDC007084 TaxID=3154313 RepID=UPI0034516AAF